MAAMNQNYLHICDVLDNIKVLEAKLQSTVEDLRRNEESVRRMEAVEAYQVKEFAKFWDENEELKRKLWDSQAGLKA